MGIAVLDAMQMARANRERAEALRARFRRLQRTIDRETVRQDRARQLIFEGTLVPFRDVYSRLQNVSLADLADLDGPPEAERPDVELEQVRISAAGAVGAFLGGTAAGAGAGALAFTAVGAFAAASTGTAISSLSGAAATGATLAWLGGGSLAAGGGGVAAGTAVLASVVALPVIAVTGVFMELQGRREKRKQREVAAQLRQAAAELELQEAIGSALCQHSRDIRLVLKRLRGALAPRIESLAALVDNKADYRLFSAEEELALAASVGLVTAAVSVMQVPLIDEGGLVPDLSRRTLTDAQSRLRAVAAA
ncbi:MAG: hypothetical protein ACRDYF_04720 [Acidimicrobiia bacterium]